MISRQVRGILVDGYAAGEKRELLSKPNLRIKRIYDYTTVYGLGKSFKENENMSKIFHAVENKRFYLQN